MSQWGQCEEFHTEWNQLLGQIICISGFGLSELSSGLSKGFLISLFVFHKCRLFLENTPLRMCKLRSCLGGINQDQGGLKLSELDKWARVWPLATVPGWTHTVLWHNRHGWQEARTMVGSSLTDKMTAQAHKTLSTHYQHLPVIEKPS